jgi:uncharacterized protein (PEP-CTERM system associated)
MVISNFSRRRTITRIVVVLLLVAVAMPSWAGRWKLRKSLDVRTYSTSNLFLTESDQRGATVLAVRPGLSATRRGGRVRVRVAYAPSLNFYLDNSSLDRVAHYLRAEVRSELIKNYFFLNASARAGQVVTDPIGRRATFDAINNPDGLSNTFSFSIRPVFQGPLLRAGRYARIRIQPGVNYSYTQDGLGGSAGRRTRINVFSGPAFSRMPWSLNYRNDIFDTDSNDGIGRVDARVGYRVNREWRVDFTLGYDDGRFRSRNDNSGLRWRSTVSWRPTSRSRFRLGIGEAFFGDDWELRFNHRHKHTAWRLSYNRRVENARQEIFQEQFIRFEDDFGEPIVDPVAAQPLGVVVDTPALIDDVYVRDRARAGVSWFRGRTSASLNVRVNRRDYQTLELDETDTRATLTLSRRLAPKTIGSTQLDYWDRSVEDRQAADFDQYAISLRLRHRLSRYLRLGVRYAHTKRSYSGRAGEDFSDNLLNLDFAFNFNQSK